MSLRGYIVNLLSEAVSVPSDAVPAAIPPEVLAMPGVLAELAAATKRIEARLLAPAVVGEPVDTVGLPPPEPVVAAATPEPPPSVVERWIAEEWNGWSLKRARSILRWLDNKDTLSDADLTVWVESIALQRPAWDARLDGLVAEWLEARGEPAPDDAAHARAARLAYAAELRATLAKRAEVEAAE